MSDKGRAPVERLDVVAQKKNPLPVDPYYDETNGDGKSGAITASFWLIGLGIVAVIVVGIIQFTGLYDVFGTVQAYFSS